MDGCVKQWWDETSATFQQTNDFDIEVNWTTYEPEPITIFDSIANQDVIELGCGGGHCSVALAKRGGNITGVDISRPQLQHARQLATQEGVDVDFIQSDIRKLDSIASRTFDVAFNTYVFHWIDDLRACFSHTYRVLRPGGRFVFSMPHPFYALFTTGEKHPSRSYFETGQYKQPIAESNNNDNDSAPITYHHTMSDILTGLIDAGFSLTAVHEPGVANTEAYQSDSGENDQTFIPPNAGVVPMTLLIEAQNPNEVYNGG